MASVRLLRGGGGFDPGGELVHRELNADSARGAGQHLTLVDAERFGRELCDRTRIFHAEFTRAGVRHAAVHDHGPDPCAAGDPLLAEHDRGGGEKVRGKGPGGVAAGSGVKESEVGFAAPFESASDAGGFETGRGSRAAAFDHVKRLCVLVQFRYLLKLRLGVNTVAFDRIRAFCPRSR